jgi:heptosyltransferase-1
MTTKILIVRTSSLGDLIHMLPAISDLSQQVPGAQIDWLVEDAFAQIPAWHPAIHEVIPLAHRKWRRNWWATEVRQARQALEQELRCRRYDIVLDMQALLKTVWFTRMATGIKHGLDWRSAREPLASLFYDVRHRVEFWQPAVTRQRQLAAAAFGYTYTNKPDFGLQAFEQEAHVLRTHETPYAVIMPSASRDDKLWPVEDWHAVFDLLSAEGLTLKLLAGNTSEVKRAEALIGHRPGAMVLPKMDLTEAARCLAASQIMVGLDSGLTHLSAALGRPTVGIYKASTPVRTPLVGDAFTASLGDRDQPPDQASVLAAIRQALS